ncbi:hypothetical protein BCR36DRAFT_65571 [Piromyces finnis]|uniref:Uncharacterized protein n=1 Tax=Piromyces finnis TaxID=1754191 RepID=A0A1Y1V953_9FUNG|nr:hypothetical protein BCR36DRAFT_65571 [Piromyces finnis]|eukprot:ORX49713.1 hypothetical protein BCR36DRAFT_65571 [Piromyces finnis]
MPEKPPLLPSQPPMPNESMNILNSPYMNSPKQMNYKTPPTIFQSLPFSQPTSGPGILQSPVQVPLQFPQQYPSLQGQIPLPMQMTSQCAPLAMNSPTLGLATPLAIQPISLPPSTLPNPPLYMFNNEGIMNPELLVSPYIVANNNPNSVANAPMDGYALQPQSYPNPNLSLTVNEAPQSSTKLKPINDDSLEKKLLDFLNNKTNSSEETPEPDQPMQGKVLDGKDILRMLNSGQVSNEYNSNENNIQGQINKENELKSNVNENGMEVNNVNQNSANQEDIPSSNQMLLKLLNENTDDKGEYAKKYSDNNYNEKQQYILGLFNTDNQDKAPITSSPSMNTNQQIQKLFEMQSSGMLNKTNDLVNQPSSKNLDQSKEALLNMFTINEKARLIQQQSQPNTLSESSVSLLEMLNKSSVSTNDLHSPQKKLLKSPILSANYDDMKLNMNNPNSIPNNMDNSIPSIPNMNYSKQSEYKEKGHGSGMNSGNNSNNNSNSNISSLLMNMLNISSKPSSPVSSPIKIQKVEQQVNTNKSIINNRSNESSMQLLEKLNETQFSSSTKNIDENENLVVNKESSQALLSMLNINTAGSQTEIKNEQKNALMNENKLEINSNEKIVKEGSSSNPVVDQAMNSLLLSVCNKSKEDGKTSNNSNSDFVQILKSSSAMNKNNNNNNQDLKVQSQQFKPIDFNALYQNVQGNTNLAPPLNASVITQSPTFTEFSMDSIDTTSIFHFNNDFIKNQRKLKMNEDSKRMMNLLKVNNNNDTNQMTKSATIKDPKNPLLDVLKQGTSPINVPTNVPINEPNNLFTNNNNDNNKNLMNTDSAPSSNALNLLSLLNTQSSNTILTTPPSSSEQNNTMKNPNNSTMNNSSIAQNPLLALINGSANINTMNTNITSMNNNNNIVPTGVSISVQDLFNSVGSNVSNMTMNNTIPPNQTINNPINANLEINNLMSYFKA